LPTSLRSVADGVASVPDGQTDRERAVRVHDVSRVTGDPGPAMDSGQQHRRYPLARVEHSAGSPCLGHPRARRAHVQSVPIQPGPVDTGAYCAALIAAFSLGPLVQQSNPSAQRRRARTAGPPALPTVDPLPHRAGQAHDDPVNACGRTWRRSRCPSSPDPRPGRPPIPAPI
jgi:hypothetical protein